MQKLTDNQLKSFQKVGEAICQSTNWAEVKKDGLRNVKDVIDNNREDFVNGITIGDYHFTIVERIELRAIDISKPIK